MWVENGAFGEYRSSEAGDFEVEKGCLVENGALREN